jgi:hypothetical protein
VLSLEASQSQDSRHLDVKVDGLYPIVMQVLLFDAKPAQFTPRLKVVAAELAILNIDDFRNFAE